MTPIIISSLAIIIFSALIHASFQLSVSVLTLLSGHSLGRKSSQSRVLKLLNGFLFGVLTATGLIVTAVVYYMSAIINQSNSSEQLAGTIICGALISMGLSTMLFYYRRDESGTALWLPRSMAEFLTKRASNTRHTAEAFSLGATSVMAEILFIIVPIAAASLAIITLPDTTWQIIGIALYTMLSMVPLVIITVIIGSGHGPAKLQKWRERNKKFLQFSAGLGLMVLSFYLFADRVVGLVSYGGAW